MNVGESQASVHELSAGYLICGTFLLLQNGTIIYLDALGLGLFSLLFCSLIRHKQLS